LPSDPYAAGLAMLARCELSTAEVVERLRRRGFAPGDVEAAVERLRDEHALDDHRTATVHARRSARIRRGPITAAIQRRFFDVINGRVADTHGWLKFVYGDPAAVTPATAGAAAGAG